MAPVLQDVGLNLGEGTRTLNVLVQDAPDALARARAHIQRAHIALLATAPKDSTLKSRWESGVRASLAAVPTIVMPSMSSVLTMPAMPVMPAMSGMGSSFSDSFTYASDVVLRSARSSAHGPTPGPAQSSTPAAEARDVALSAMHGSAPPRAAAGADTTTSAQCAGATSAAGTALAVDPALRSTQGSSIYSWALGEVPKGRHGHAAGAQSSEVHTTSASAACVTGTRCASGAICTGARVQGIVMLASPSNAGTAASSSSRAEHAGVAAGSYAADGCQGFPAAPANVPAATRASECEAVHTRPHAPPECMAADSLSDAAKLEGETGAELDRAASGAGCESVEHMGAAGSKDPGADAAASTLAALDLPTQDGECSGQT